jgi:hypothetical protein
MATRRALLVAGPGRGDPPPTELQREISDLASVLGDQDIGGYEVELLDDPHTEEVRLWLERLVESMGDEDELLFYFYGHAAKDEEENLWLLTRDSESSGSPFNGFSADLLLREVGRSDVGSLVVILDCSYGAAIFEKGLPVGEGTPVIWIMTSSSASGQATVGSFTPRIIRGLQDGSADTDGDGLVSFNDLFQYVVRRAREAGDGQQPWQYATSATSDIYLAKNPTAAASRPGGGRVAQQLPTTSRSVQQVIGYATALADSGPVDATILFYAALSYSHELSLPGVTAELLRLLTERQGKGTDPDALLDRVRQMLGTGQPRVHPTALEAESSQPVRPGSPTAYLLNLAGELAQRITGEDQVHLRHLVLATVVAEPPLSPEVLNTLNISAPELRALLLEAARLGVEPEEAWHQLLAGATDVPSQPFREATSEGLPTGDAADASPEFSDDLAGDLSADLVKPDEGIPADRDHLGMSTYVGMFASVIAYHKTPLPLSIGLFGEWGSGKSTFMGLLRDRVKTLSHSANPDYCHDIVQIGFNAWSYADSNLWASLGDEIFRQLVGPGAADDHKRPEALNKELQQTLERATELKAAKKKAEDEAAQLHADLAAARKDYTNSLTALVKATAQTGATTVLGEAWSTLGVTKEAQQVEILVNETRGVHADAVALRRVVGRRRRWVFFLAILAVVGVALLFSALWADKARTLLSSAGATALLASVVIATTAARKARAALQAVGAEAARINARIEQNADEEFIEEVGAVRQANARREVIQAQLDEVLSRAGELGRELVDVNPGQRLYTFLSERAASNDYRGELGLISTIRKDFQQLIKLMDEWKKHPDEKAGHRPIDRIVLYIDDLDRCSPRQVVDVLQAVHLLLALDLFVVVVGVDPRWLLHSLRQQYQQTLATERAIAEGDAERLWASTPGDYLEKIFNIPFVLPTMTPETFESLIESLAASSTEAYRAGPGGNSAESSTDEVAGLNSAREVSDAETATGGSPTGVPSVPAPAAQQTATLLHAEAGSEVAAHEAASAGADGKGITTPIPRPRPLTEGELNLIYALAPMVGTPREAKRLFNLYRMLRSTRNLSDASRFLGGARESGQYQAAAVLLGLLTAYPRLLGQMLWASPDDKQCLAGGLCTRARDDMTWAQFLDSLDPEEKDGQWRNAVSSQLSEAERDQWSRLVSTARLSAELVRLPDLSAFRYWGDHEGYSGKRNVM